MITEVLSLLRLVHSLPSPRRCEIRFGSNLHMLARKELSENPVPDNFREL